MLPVWAVAQEMGITGSSHFRRQLDSFNWLYEAGFNHSTENLNILFSNQFHSRFSLFEGDVRNLQDENTAHLNASGWLNQHYGIAGEARSYRFSNTNVKNDYALAGIMYRPQDAISLILLGGVMQDERSQQSDRGWMAGLRGRAEPFTIGDFTVASELYIDYADISPRSMQTYRWNTISQLDIENFALEGNLEFARNIRESYQASSFFNQQVNDFVESVRSDTTGIDLSARFPLFNNLQSRLDVSLLTNVRKVTNTPLFPDIEQTFFDTQIQRQQVNIRFQTSIPNRNNNFTIGFNYTIGARDAQLINTETLPDDELRRRSDILINSNFDQSRFELFTFNRIQLSPKNNTDISGNISIMNYDTPGLNRDDRDELFLQARLLNEHIFSEYFTTKVTLAGEAVHSVYLFAERSIENNWRRSIRLIPEFEWEPVSWLTYRQQLLVRANYTVEDFELPGRQKNDQVSREFALNSQFNVRIAQDWSVDVQGSRSELRIGRLLWDEFSEIPTDTLITYDSRIMITHESGGMLTSVGVRYFYKWDFQPRLTIVTDDVSSEGEPIVRTRSAPGRQTTVQWGPMVQMRLPLYSKNELIVNGWYQIQAVRQKLFTEYPEEFRELFLHAERIPRKQFFPNLEIIARFRF